jgi:hypothetical protein
MTSIRSLVRLALPFALFAAPSWALVAGGGPAKSDCYAEWQVTSMGVTGKTTIDCQDGDTACDADGVADGQCTFNVSICLFQTDAALSKCTPQTVTGLSASSKVKPKGTPAVSPPAPPALPASAAVCGNATTYVVRAGKGRKRQKITLKLKATASGQPKSDADKLNLLCTAAATVVRCPANPSGADQPNEIQLTVANGGTDLDNGRSGPSQNFPTQANSKLQLCLQGCNATDNPNCTTTLPVGAGTFNKGTFGPPLPLFTAGIPVCVQNRYVPTQPAGTANLQTGEINGTIMLNSDVFLTDETNVCPRCETGSCNSGPNIGKPCSVDGFVTVVEAATTNKLFQLSKDCPPPTDLKAGTLIINLPLTSGTSTLTPLPGGSAATPCVKQPGEPTGLPPLPDICPAGGTCTATCTGNACATQGVDYVTGLPACIDAKGGISQFCCSNKTDNPCFPTGPGSIGVLSRTGRALPPQPPWPDPTYPKTTDCSPGSCTVQVGAYCEAATGTGSVDGLAGLPGPGAITLPVTTRWLTPAQ